MFIKRKAIIIACPGPNQNFLPGVMQDKQHVKRFLLSNRGGRWKEEEIIVLENPTAAQINAEINSCTVDYLFIYFSGHGFMTLRGDRMLCCSGASVPDWHLVDSPTQIILLVNDACRSFVGYAIGSIDATEEEYFNFTGPTDYRKMFDEAIFTSAPAKIIIHGTQAGMPAADTAQGGAFTKALLMVGSRMYTRADSTVVGIDHVLSYVPAVLSKRGNKQEPELIYYLGSTTLPFCIAMPKPIVVNENQRSRQPERQETNSNVPLGVAALLLIGAIVVSSR